MSCHEKWYPIEVEIPNRVPPPTPEPVRAMRYNSGKPEIRYAFCFLPALEELAKTCMVGAKKYELYNFMKPCPVSESYDCLMRHLGSVWFHGELEDSEGNSHLGAIVFNSLRLVNTILTHPEMDDRPKNV